MKRTFFAVVLILYCTGLGNGLFADILDIPEDYKSIQAGIDASQDGDTILVNPGLYVENLDVGNRAITIASWHIIDRNYKYIEKTVIDGNFVGDAIRIADNNQFNLVGLTIQNGGCVSKNAGSKTQGGGIVAIYSSLNICNCIVTANATTGYYGEHCEVEMTDCRFESNLGDGAVNHDGHSVVVNCRFINNGNRGCDMDDDYHYEDDEFRGNNGYGLSIRGDGQILRCNFIENENSGLYADHTTALIEDCLFESNGPAFMGGGFLSYHSNSDTLRHCIFRNNRSTATGGAIRSADFSYIRLEKCLIVGNQSDDGENNGYGGAIYGRVAAEFDIDHCTIYGNRARMAGGAFAAGAGLWPSIKNSIIYNNGENPINYAGGSGNLSAVYSLIEGGREEVDMGDGEIEEWLDIIDTDPLFIDPDNGDFSLSVDSPCIDAGDPESALDSDGTRADMGAFYFHQRDIAVEPTELHFEPIGWGERASQQVEIRNEGGTTLHIFEIPFPLGFSSITFFPLGIFDPPIEIAPDSVFILTATFEPNPEVPNVASCEIISDDPDEEIVSIEATGEVSGVNDEPKHPVSFSLSSPYPNPFNSTTTIGYSLPVAGNVSLAVYDLRGREVARLVDGVKAAGTHEAVWVADGVAAGIYFVRLRSNNSQFTQKILLVK